MEKKELTESEAKKKFMPFLIVCCAFIISGATYCLVFHNTPTIDESAGSSNRSSSSVSSRSSSNRSSSSSSSGSSSYSSSLKTCPSCGNRVSSLKSRELIKGNGDWKSWCQDCWDSYDELSPYSNSSVDDYDSDYDYDYDYDYDDYVSEYNRSMDEYNEAVGDIADVYGMSEEEVDAAIRAVWGY